MQYLKFFQGRLQETIISYEKFHIIGRGGKSNKTAWASNKIVNKMCWLIDSNTIPFFIGNKINALIYSYSTQI